MTARRITREMADIAEKIIAGMAADDYAIELLEDDAKRLAESILDAFNAKQGSA